jgi:murein tripeptide amidase MpaA
MTRILLCEMILCLFVVCLEIQSALADEPTMYLPEARPWSGPSESLIAPSEERWITPAERHDLTRTPRYAESIAWLEELCDASRLLTLIEFGRSSQGRPLYLVVASQELDHTPDSLRTSGKPTMLVQAGIHSGEIDGKDAGLMLLRDIAFRSKEKLLDQANLLFIPVLNPDGHERASVWNRPNQRGPIEMGWRTTAQNLNLNRDYVKADAPEMQALLTLLNRWPIQLYLDIHVTDGLDYQYDVTYAYHGRGKSPSWSPNIASWLDKSFCPAIKQELEHQGHLPLNLYVTPVDKRNLGSGLKEGLVPPRFSQGYGDLRHLPTVLVETHSLKPYRQRVLATYVLIESSLKHLATDGEALKAAIATDCKHRQVSIPLTWVNGGEKYELDFLGFDFDTYHSSASGSHEVRWLGKPRTYPLLSVFPDKIGVVASRPKAYWIPVTKAEVIAKLRLHGIEMEMIDEPKTVAVEMYRVTPGPDHTESKIPYESRFRTALQGLKVERREETFPIGSVRVSTDQKLGDLAIMMLEPYGSDSLFGWGFFNEILQQTEYIEGYIIAPVAEKMLARDSRLKAEFDQKVVSDAKFASDPNARLQWFYARTQFADERFLLYPVGLERSSE